MHPYKPLTHLLPWSNVHRLPLSASVPLQPLYNATLLALQHATTGFREEHPLSVEEKVQLFVDFEQFAFDMVSLEGSFLGLFGLFFFFSCLLFFFHFFSFSFFLFPFFFFFFLDFL